MNSKEAIQDIFLKKIAQFLVCFFFQKLLAANPFVDHLTTKDTIRF